MYQLFTHNDLDGVGCGIVARIAFGDDLEIRYNTVNGLDFQVARFLERKNEKHNLGKVIFITDLSINQENAKGLDEFVKEGGKAQLIDHHKTALHLNEHSWGTVKVQYEDGRLTSATSLFYEYLLDKGLIESNTALNEFVELVRQYDTWEWDQNDNVTAKHLNDLFFMVSIDEFEERMVDRIRYSENFEFSEFENKLLEMEEDKIERYVRRKNRELVQVTIGDHVAGIVHAESYHSELGNELGKEHTHLDYIAILNMGGKKIAFRTIHDHIDVSAIADNFGGGGHAKAAGCSLNDKAFGYYVKSAFELEPIKQDAFKNHYNVKNSPQGCLFETRKEDKIFIYHHSNNWIVEVNQKALDKKFSSFEEAEKFIKRSYFAWLVKDEIYVEFLKDSVVKTRLYS